MDKVLDLVNRCELELKDKFNEIDELCLYNSEKVLKAFRDNNVSEMHFNGTTGYGYNDAGREVVDKVFASVLDTEDALVRLQLICGSHALTVCLFALLRPNDTLLSISGKPYDTLDEVIGITDNKSSLKSFGIKYEQIDLVNNDFDYELIEKTLKSKKIKVIEIQRSIGYSTRKSLTVDKVSKVVKFIKEIDPEVIIMVDNCYCEFVEKNTLSKDGVDVFVGSLIKNLGGSITRTGGYIAGRKDIIDLCKDRLFVPGEGGAIGPTFGFTKEFLQGLYMAPSACASALKTSILTSKIMQKLGFKVDPLPEDKRADIIQSIIFEDPDKLICYIQSIQASGPIDSNVIPIPEQMDGYPNDIIMAAGTFTQGSTIEFSCDGPVRPPYIAYQQGGVTYEYGKLILINVVKKLVEKFDISI